MSGNQTTPPSPHVENAQYVLAQLQLGALEKQVAT
jgi:hypothetical protein